MLYKIRKQVYNTIIQTNKETKMNNQTPAPKEDMIAKVKKEIGKCFN